MTHVGISEEEQMMLYAC